MRQVSLGRGPAFSDKSNRNVLGIFAFNEERLIRACIESIAAHGGIDGLSVVVLANGCSDQTVSICRGLTQKYAWLNVEDIALGDKASAWNLLVHDIAGDADTIFFLDGDCTVLPGALQQLATALAERADAWVVSAVPVYRATSLGSFRRQMLRKPGVAGNLYAMSSRFLHRLREADVRMPRGWIGDDSLIGALARSDLDPAADWKDARVHVCRDAAFAYEPAIWMIILNPMAYIKRKTRYSLRYFQNHLLGDLLRRDGLAAMPRDVERLYAAGNVDRLRPRWTPWYFWFDRQALRHILQVRKLRSTTPA